MRKTQRKVTKKLQKIIIYDYIKNKPKALALGSFLSGAKKSCSAIGNGRKSIKKQIRKNPYLFLCGRNWEKEMLEISKFPIYNYTAKGVKSPRI